MLEFLAGTSTSYLSHGAECSKQELPGATSYALLPQLGDYGAGTDFNCSLCMAMWWTGGMLMAEVVGQRMLIKLDLLPVNLSSTVCVVKCNLL